MAFNPIHIAAVAVGIMSYNLAVGCGQSYAMVKSPGFAAPKAAEKHDAEPLKQLQASASH